MALFLQLGDIIRIIAPSNKEFDGRTYYIHYYDPNELMEIIHISSLLVHTIPLKDGKILDHSIEKIVLLNRSVQKGFARQNGLLPNTWVDLEFRGDVRSVIIAQITHLEEDMIELMTFPEKDILYIDFAYKGIPKNIPFKHICICNRPANFEDFTVPISSDESLDTEIIEEARTEYNADGELIIDLPANVDIEQNYRDKLHDEYSLIQKETPEQESISEQNEEFETIHYGIDAQMNFLLDDFLSILPDDKRTKQAMRDIYIHLNRFKELRDIYSTRNEYGEINGFIKHDPKYFKPLVNNLYEMKNIPKWIIPVANVKQHIYLEDVDTVDPHYDTLLFDINDSICEEERIKKTMFFENPGTSESVKYESLYSSLNQNIYTPQSILINPVIHPVGHDLDICTDIDMFLGSNGTNKSSSVRRGKGEVDVPTHFIDNLFKVRRFESPIYYSKYMRKNYNELHILMKGDRIHVQSLVYLPEVQLQNTQHLYGNILSQTKYSAPYLFDLMKHTPVTNMEVNIEKSHNSILPFESSIVDIKMTPTENPIHDIQLKNPSYHAFLQTLVPDIFSLIEHYYAKNANKYNSLDYLKSFSPYDIDMNSLSYRSFESIRRHLYKNIQNYYSNYEQSRDGFIQYLLAKYNIPKSIKSELYIPLLDRIFLENSVQKNEFRSLCHLTGVSEREHLRSIMDINNGKSLFSWILLSNLELISPTNLIAPFSDTQKFNNIQHKIITKKYSSLREMQEDNDKRDVRYDEQYDYNHYDVLNKYKKEMTQYPPEQFLDFLSETLAKEYGCSLDNVRNMAEELVQGFKLVQENDYAILEITPHLPEGVEEFNLTKKDKDNIKIEASVRKIEKYFKRIDNVWVYDPDVDEESFHDPRELLCLLKNDVPKETAQNAFKNPYGNSMEEIQKNIKDLIIKYKQETEIIVVQNKRKLLEHDKYFSKLGNMAYISENIVSPNKKILDDLTHKSIGFENQQENIIWFVELYCRDAYSEEDDNWKYCKESESSVQLIPNALYELALGFQRNEYSKTFSHLVKNKKIKYEDGRFIVVHGGSILEDIEFSEQGTELYENLDEQDTWDTEEDTLDTNYSVDMKQGKRLYMDKKLRSIYNVMSGICKMMYVPFDRIETNSMNISTMFLTKKNIFMGEAKYDKAMKKIHKDAKYPSYEIFQNSKLLDIATCSVLISVQCVMPSLKYSRSVGDCIKVLDGYPLNMNSGQEGTIEYFGCILRKMHGDRKSMPWNTISKSKGDMEKRLKDMIVQFLKHDEIEGLLREKRQYLESESNEIPEDIHIVNTWERFLPPLKSSGILDGKAPLRNVEKSAHEMLKKTLDSGSHDQWIYLGMYFGKILNFSIAFTEIINKIVQEKGSLLKSGNTRAWLENACCNDSNAIQNPSQYFAQQHESITEYKKVVLNLETAIEKVRLYIKPSILHKKNPERVPNQLIQTFSLQNISEELMYRTFIHYCNLDSVTKPIPNHFEKFIQKKLEEYNSKGSIEEKIDFLKSKQKTMNSTSFGSLLTTSFRNNSYVIVPEIVLSYHEKVVSLLNTIESTIPSDIISQFKYHFDLYINRESNTVPSENEANNQEQHKTKLLDNLENFVIQESENMENKIRDFLRSSGMGINPIETLIHNMKIDKDTTDHTTMGNFVKNHLYYICIIVPNYIINNHKLDNMYTRTILLYEDVPRVVRHIRKKFDYLNDFVNDNVIKPLLKTAIPKLQEYYRFYTQHSGFFPSDRVSLHKRFAHFSLIFVYYYLISITEDKDTLQIIFKHIQTIEAEHELEELDDDVEEIELQAAETHEIQKQLQKFLKKLFDTEEIFNRENKSLLTSYEVNRQNEDRLKQMEKVKIMSRFDPKNEPEHRTRRAEKDMKKYHLGKYYINQNVIKNYGKKRDEMLDTDDVHEEDFLLMEKQRDQPVEEQEYLEELNDIFGEDLDMDMDIPEEETLEETGDLLDEEEHIAFLRPREDDDNYDIAEYEGNA